MPASGWLRFDSATRTFEGTPRSGDQGLSSITVTALYDAAALSASDVFDVRVLNRAPAEAAGLTVARHITATVNVPLVYQLAAGVVVDADGDAVTFTAENLPGWLSFNGTSRRFAGTPRTGDQGTTPVRLVATDSVGERTTFPIDFEVLNRAPTVAQPIPDQTGAVVGNAFVFAFAAGTFADADGDRLSYAVDASTPLPTWLSFNATSRTFAGVPPATAANLYTVAVVATDPFSGSVSDSFNIAVRTGSLFLSTPIPDQVNLQVGTLFRSTLPLNTFTLLDFPGRDASNLRYEATGLPASGWLRFDSATRTFEGVRGPATRACRPSQ